MHIVSLTKTTKCQNPWHIGSVGNLNKYITQRTTANSHLTDEIDFDDLIPGLFQTGDVIRNFAGSRPSGIPDVDHHFAGRLAVNEVIRGSTNLKLSGRRWKTR